MKLFSLTTGSLVWVPRSPYLGATTCMRLLRCSSLVISLWTTRRVNKRMLTFEFFLICQTWVQRNPSFLLSFYSSGIERRNMCLFLLTLNNNSPVIGGSHCHDKFLLAESNFTISGLVDKCSEPRKSLTSKPHTIQKVFRGTPHTLSLYFPLPHLISNHQTDLQLHTLP